MQSLWRCTVLPVVVVVVVLLLLIAAPRGAMAHNYTYQHGALPAGNDAIQPALLTLGAAEAKCSALPACVGITFKSPDKAPTGAVKMYFKDKFTIVSADPSYQTCLLLCKFQWFS